MLSEQFLNFDFGCEDPNCATNNLDSGYICDSCQALWLKHLLSLGPDDLYEFFLINQEFLNDDEYIDFLTQTMNLGDEVEDPRAYFQELNFNFFNNRLLKIEEE